MKQIPECLNTAPPRPMSSCPSDFVRGAAPNSPALAVLSVIGLAAVWYYTTHTNAAGDMREIAMLAGAGLGSLLLAVLLRWVLLIVSARALFRDGLLVHARVTQLVTVRQRQAGAQTAGTILFFNIAVEFDGPGGDKRAAYFRMVNRKVFETLPILVNPKGNRVGLYLEPFNLTPQVKIPSIFRMTTSRSA